MRSGTNYIDTQFGHRDPLRLWLIPSNVFNIIGCDEYQKKRIVHNCEYDALSHVHKCSELGSAWCVEEPV